MRGCCVRFNRMKKSLVVRRGRCAFGLVVVASLFLVSAGYSTPVGNGALEGGGRGGESIAAGTVAPASAWLEAAAGYSERYSGRAVLVMHRGEVVYEGYSGGWDADRPHALASGTKSFMGVVAMAAIEDGLIAGLDEKVSETLTEWKGDARKREITVRQLLDLSSGLEPGDASLGRAGAGIRDLGPGGEVAARLRERRGEELPEDRFAAAVNIPATERAGAAFRYGPSHFYAFGAFLERKLVEADRPQKTYFGYMRERVLMPAGLGDVGLDRFAPDKGGKPNLPGGGHLTAREWGLFGEFVRRGGRTRVLAGEVKDDRACPDLSFKGASPVLDASGSVEVSAIDSALIEKCFEPSRANAAYGLTWWLLTGAEGAVADVSPADGLAGRRRAARQAAQTAGIVGRDGKVVPVVMAAGAGKQRLYILPEQELVVVRFARLDREGNEFNDTEFLRLLLGVDE